MMRKMTWAPQGMGSINVVRSDREYTQVQQSRPSRAYTESFGHSSKLETETVEQKFKKSRRSDGKTLARMIDMWSRPEDVIKFGMNRDLDANPKDLKPL